jgi:hypothetical protein
MLGRMASEDWRVRIELEEESGPQSLLERIRDGFGLDARELEDALGEAHLAVSRDGDHLFVYAGSRDQARKAREAIEAEVELEGLAATISQVEHWLAAEGRWDNEPADESWEEELRAEGYAPWEVRITCASHDAAEELAERLEADGYRPVRRWRFLIVGADSREDAESLAASLHGMVEPGGALVWNEALDARVVRPFTLF